MELVKGYIKQYAIEGTPHAVMVEDLYAVYPNGKVVCRVGVKMPNAHFDDKGAVWLTCHELSVDTLVSELEYIGQYPFPKTVKS